MNSRGQEFAGFRLLIDAVMVLFILVIIIGILTWVDSQRFTISEKRFYESFSKAVNSPNGQVVVEKNMSFSAGSYYLNGAFAIPGIPKECITFQALNLRSIDLGEDGKYVGIEENVVLDVFYRCQRLFDEDCDIKCEISIGKDFS